MTDEAQLLFYQLTLHTFNKSSWTAVFTPSVYRTRSTDTPTSLKKKRTFILLPTVSQQSILLF